MTLKIQKELEGYKMQNQQEVKHAKVQEMRKEYDEKMKIIEEIKRDKERQEEEEKLLKEKVSKKR